jgi:hypothetical protein
MALQLRRKGSNDPLYAVARDVAYLHDGVIHTVNMLLEDREDPILTPLLKANRITLDDLGEAAGAYCRFMNSAHKDPAATVESCLVKAGWFEVEPLARLAYCYYVGTAMTATFFHGIREVSDAEQDKPLASIQQILWTVKRVAILARMTRWQRFLYRWVRPWRKYLWKKHKIEKG